MDDAPQEATRAGAGSTAEAYAGRGAAMVPAFVDPAVAAFLADHAALLLAAGHMTDDGQVPGSSSIYGDPAFDALLERVTPAASAATGRSLVPTYSFARIYRRGQELVPHRDRPSCQHSASVHLASDDGTPWPIALRRAEEAPETFVLGVGDAVLYRGDELLHWRDPLTGGWHVQVFLHWVDADGPFAEHVWDGRPGLGRPASERRR